LNRRFRISELPIFNKNLYLQVVEKAKSKIYPSGKYKIYASDLNPEMITMAESNAKRA
jgi:23S rRNA G2445 N2-methylase RlmL